MAHVDSIGTYLQSWGTRARRVPGDDEDALTLAVEAGRAALADRAGAQRVVLVSRDLPLLEGGNAAVLLAGLGLDLDIEVSEILGGAPAVLDAVSSARPHTLVIGADTGSAGAAAACPSMVSWATPSSTKSSGRAPLDGRGRLRAARLISMRTSAPPRYPATSAACQAVM